MENQQPYGEPTSTGGPSSQDFGYEVKSFLTQSLPGIIKTIFSSPIEGTKQVFAANASSAFVNGAILIGVTFVVSLLLSLLIQLDMPYGSVRVKDLFQMGLASVLPLLFITLFTFALKSVAGKADIKNELLTGGLCGLILSLSFIIIYLFVKLSGGALNMMSFMMGGGNIFILLFFVFGLLFMVNIVQQSLRGSGTKDTLSWYMAPVIILVSFYIGFKLMSAIF